MRALAIVARMLRPRATCLIEPAEQLAKRALLNDHGLLLAQRRPERVLDYHSAPVGARGAQTRRPDVDVLLVGAR